MISISKYQPAIMLLYANKFNLKKFIYFDNSVATEIDQVVNKFCKNYNISQICLLFHDVVTNS